MRNREKERAGIQRFDYHPAGAYRLDLEILQVSDVRRRVGMEAMQSTHRYTFHVLVCVTYGESTHTVDFKPVRCRPGSLLTLRPGQAHNFGLDESWDGWMILFRQEFLPSAPAAAPDLRLVVGLERLPEHLPLPDTELRRVTDAVAQMREDAGIDAPLEEVHALLRYQLYALLQRLSIIQDRQEGDHRVSAPALQRFKDFRRLLEENFARWHQVTDYARRLGCSERSLTRATMEVSGVGAKAFIASRINLEAKRLLVHTHMSVTVMAEYLGFDEATNFIKFFRREAGCTPVEFRRRQQETMTVGRADTDPFA